VCKKAKKMTEEAKEETKDVKPEEKDLKTLRFICIAVGVVLSLIGMRFILGKTSALYGALAGAGGVVLGSLLFGVVLKIKGYKI
jgi:hypothetical protein